MPTFQFTSVPESVRENSTFEVCVSSVGDIERNVTVIVEAIFSYQCKHVRYH